MTRKHSSSLNQAGRWLSLGIALFVLRSAVAAETESKPRSAQPFSIRWVPDAADSNKLTAEVFGLDFQTLSRLRRSPPKDSKWQRLFSVHAEQGNALADIGMPPMAGAYFAESNTLRFVPQFPLTAGVRYRATFDPSQLRTLPKKDANPISDVFEVPARRLSPTTIVRHVYPSADVLPENLLKFYVHFSSPMSRGGIYEHIHLRDEAGKAVELPFLEIEEELWDPEMMRLTLFIDPGRIKRGVKPLEEIGPALEAGRRYTLVIDRAWKDAMGISLQATFEKSFRVAAPDREPPDPGRWKVATPAVGTRDALTVDFAEPMDHALAQRMIRVTSESGASVDGTTQLAELERRWNFTPSQAWEAGKYNLMIQTTIEDLAGNNIGKPFEVDLFNGVQRRLTNSTVRIAFAIR